MPKNGISKGLPLPRLSISGFRGIGKLEIEELGRVTLLTGKNGVGKTTVLEAVHIFASRGLSLSVWKNLFQRHDEYREYLSTQDDLSENAALFDLRSVFHGRELTSDSAIFIGPPPKDKQLAIRLRNSKGKEKSAKSLESRWPLVASYDGHEYPVPLPTNVATEEIRDVLRKFFETEFTLEEPSPADCFFLGPNLLQNEEIGPLWGQAVLKGVEHHVVEALKLVLGANLERINMIEMQQGGLKKSRAVATLKNQNQPVPLRSLGDGAVRILGLASALVANRGGFLLIDEVENGIHHSVQANVWRFLLRAAEENDVQIIATTHGFDCVKKFARVASEEEEINGMLVRLEKGEKGKLEAVEYPEEVLLSAIQYNFEVR